MISAFYTTLEKPENREKISLLSSIKPFICILGHKPAYESQNHKKRAVSYVLKYNLNTFYLNRRKIKCI
jgi:hypothetical protein